MGFVGKLLLAVLTAFVALGAYKVFEMLQPKPVPRLGEPYWGPGNPKQDDTSIRPFKINFSDEGLKDLNNRLRNTRKSLPPLEGTNFEYGLHSYTMDKIVNYWLTEYKWKEREVFLNKFPQYKTSVQGLDIHYIHVKPATKVKTVPILLLHGWPGSVREFYKLIPLLTADNRDFAFEVVAPSLPGYAFSTPAAKPGLSPAHIGVIFKNLMKRLGHDKFYIHGGDWGAVISESMATLFPDNVLGLHSTMCAPWTPRGLLKYFLGSFAPQLVVDEKHQSLMYPLGEKFSQKIEGSGYLHLQATKPDSLGLAFSDSPAGLAGYIIEKYASCISPQSKTERDGGLPGPYTYEELLDIVMYYWISGSITSSMRIYAENFSNKGREEGTGGCLTTVPTACARFRHEIMYYSDSILKEKFVNLVQTTDYDEGGHFAALILPEVVAKDIKLAVTKMMSVRNKS